MRSVHRLFLVASILGFGAPLAAQVPPRSKPASLPQTYGTSAVSYVEVPAVGFLAQDSSNTYALGPGLGKYATNCSGACLIAPLHLPAGAQLVYLELDFIDTNASATVYGTLFQCDYAGQNCTIHPAAGAGPGDCFIAGLICSGNAFSGGQSFESADLTPDGITVDNFNNSYSLAAGGTSFGSTTAIGGMIVGYVLQVSPAPATATFTDVPTSDFGFQFVEAFNAAGITVGCNVSPPMFCPDRNVTRREMAIFFAKALGLQFP